MIKQENTVDRFNSRLLFPVNNITGDTIAFGGRIIRESKLAKVLSIHQKQNFIKRKYDF
jgi:DNA primase